MAEQEQSMPEPDLRSKKPVVMKWKRHKNLPALVLFFTGLVLLVGGITLVTAPEISREVSTASRVLRGIGFQNGNLILAGLVFLALGLFARSLDSVQDGGGAKSTKASAAPAFGSNDKMDFALVLEQVVTDTTQLRLALARMEKDVTGLKGRNQEMISHQKEAAKILQNLESTGHSGQPDEDHNKAVFRLAASVDQLDAKMDERLREFLLGIQNHIEGGAKKQQGTGAKKQHGTGAKKAG